MLAFADDAALARLVIAATRRARSRWLHDLARTIEDRAAGRTRQRRHVSAAARRAFTAPNGHIEASLRCPLGGQTGKTYARSEPYRL